MNEDKLKNRTKQFSLRAIRLALSLTDYDLGRVIRRQLLRSSTSVAANYRAVCRAKSKADFLHKLAIVEEELDESMYWMELIIECEIQPKELVSPLYNEANEILSIVVASIKTTRKKTRDSSAIQNPKSKIQNLQQL